MNLVFIDLLHCFYSKVKNYTNTQREVIRKEGKERSPY